jgi:ribosomal protein S18 acetylase RimI-like enzyme
MSGSEWSIRDATADDAAALSAFAERSFRETFTESNTASDMDAYCASAFSAQIQARELEDAGIVTLVVENGDGLIGYAQLVANKRHDAVVAERPIELKRFYVDKAFHGTLLASALMRASAARAQAAGADVVWLGVWERNPRAIRFYQKNGFREVGEHVFTVGADPQRDLVMSRPCQP